MTVIKFEDIRNMGNPADNPYLQRPHVRQVNYNNDKSIQTVAWNCWPKQYQYAYSYFKKTYYGYLSGGTPSERGGILRYFGPTPSEDKPGSKYYVLPEVVRNVRRNVFEGIRIRNLWWKTSDNNVWNKREGQNINNYNDATISISSSKNGTVVDIEVEYELCTMGFPHRDVPFFFFSRHGYGNMANGSQFKDSTPGKSPGESYSKVSNAWTFSSYEWGDPRVTCRDDNGNITNNKTKAGWTYKNAVTNDGQFDSHRTAYGSLNTYEYQTKKPYLEHEGWISDTPYAPQYGRKSTYWTYVRTYKDRFVFNGIIDKPAEIPHPNMPAIEVVRNHCGSDLRGEEGTVKVRYTHPWGHSGYIYLFAVQRESSTYCSVKPVRTNVWLSNNEVYTINVDFKGLGLKRSAEVRYYVDAYINDPNYGTKGISTCIGSPNSSVSEVDKFWNSCSSGHYFNEEPTAPTTISFDNSFDTTLKARLTWNHVNDPDGDSKKYCVYIAREDDKYNTQSETFWGNFDTGVYKYEKCFYGITNNYYDIDMSNYGYLENIRAWVKVYDDYINSYYYSSNSANVIKIKSPLVNITTSLIESSETNPINGRKMVDGTKGRITVEYKHDRGVPGIVELDAYQSNPSGSDGAFFKTLKNITFDNSMINGNQTSYSQTFDIDFIQDGFVRSRDIKYFGKGRDDNGNKSYYDDAVKWSNCTKGHHFNDEPEPVIPWINNLNTLQQDEVAELKWNKPNDTDGDTSLYYNIYLRCCETDSMNTKSKEFYGPYISGTQRYHKEFRTTQTYYDLNITSFNDEPLEIWIESHDHYYNNYYYSGQVLPFQNIGLAPNEPKIIVYAAHGEEGELSILYSHNADRNGYVNLYAMCKYLDGSKKIFTIFENKYVINGDGLLFTSDFVKLFGKNPSDRSCEIRYFATARTQGFDSDETSTVPSSWVPNVNMWEDWIGGHYFNEEPPKPNLVLDNNESNLYSNAYFTWNPVTDPDNDNVKYQVYLRAKSDVYSYSDKYIYFYGQNKEEDLAMYCEMIAETSNTSLNLDLTHFETYAEEFDLWVRPWDMYENSYYYNSDVIHFQKLEYSKPVMNISVTPVHGEKGSLKITYTHPDALLEGQAAIDRGCTDGLVKLYAYIEGLEFVPVDITYLLNGTDSNNAKRFIHDQSQTITVDFSKDLKCYRSRNISYFAIARDVNDNPGLYSTDYKYNNVPDSERYFGHYYNGIPSAPEPYNGVADTVDDKRIYDFIYTNIMWNATPDPDEDIVDYYLYIKTPTALNENLITKEFTYNDQKVSRQYSRKYKIEPIFDATQNNIKHYQISIYNNGVYETLSTKPNLCFRLDYLKNPVDWPESANGNGVGVYSYWIESRDRYNNSYYNSSNEIIRERKQHEKPNKVKLTCTPAHGEHGDIHIKYTHPENLDAKIYLYAYMNEENKHVLIDTLDAIFTPEQLFDNETTGIDISIEIDYNVKFTNYIDLKRSNNICYYAIAEDTLVGFLSDDRLPDQIPYLEKTTGHYYNEEPPITTPLFLASVINDFEPKEVKYEETPFNTITLVWKKVSDPDNDNVNYTIYMNGDSDKYESKTKRFYGDYNSNLNIGELGYSIDEAHANSLLDQTTNDVAYIENLNLKQYAQGDLTYNYCQKISPNSVNQDNILINKETKEEYIYYTFDISLYKENAVLSIWIETDDNYENSYYRSGKILVTRKGHVASPIDAAWPKSYSTIYAKTPRVVIKLAEDNLKQEVIVYWKDTWYSNKNKNHLDYFSCSPKITVNELGEIDQYIVFRPPTSQTAIHNSKVTYAVKVNNTCSESEAKWFECKYHVFGNDFTSDKFIPIKYIHNNILRGATQKLIDAYGKDYISDDGFIIKDRVVNKNDIVDNNDYNEIATPLRNLNEYINKIDNSLNMDDNSNVVIKEDFDLIEYEEHTDETYMTSDYKEWKILLYLLQNM